MIKIKFYTDRDVLYTEQVVFRADEADEISAAATYATYWLRENGQDRWYAVIEKRDGSTYIFTLTYNISGHPGPSWK